MTDNSNVSTQTTHVPAGSTLIEFPGVNRNRPAWRKELSERFREIQQRRAREAALEAEAELRLPLGSPAPGEPEGNGPASRASEATKQLGLVPTPDEPELNPIVANALRRVERARRQAEPGPPVTRGGSARGHAAAAAARVVEERPEPDADRLSTPAPRTAEQNPAGQTAEKQERPERPSAAEPARASGLLVVQQRPAPEPKAGPAVESKAPATAEVKPSPAAARPEVGAKAEARAESKAGAAVTSQAAAPAAKAVAAPATSGADAQAAAGAKPQPRKISGVIDDHWLERREAELLPRVEAAGVTYDDRAPRLKRLAAGVLDLVAVAFLSAPCAAVIELTIGDWSEPRVLASMGGVVLLMMFLYHTCSVALASRTFGMKLLGLHAVDAGTARVPTTWQCARRAFVYIISLAAFGLGLLYSLFDAEGRTVHDLLSGTVVVRE